MLAKTPGLEVIARTSSFYFKGRQATIGEIAGTLNVANVIEGSVRKAGNTLRVTAQLIRARDGVNLWSETYDRDLKDVFEVQDDIARGVVEKLKLTLLPNATDMMARTQNTDAYSLYLQGRFFLARDSESDLSKAQDFFQKAAVMDPSYAPAWAGQGTVAIRRIANAFVGMDQGLAAARAAASKALQADPNNGDGCAVLATELLMRMKWLEGESTATRCLRGNPDNPLVLLTSAVSARQLGHDEESLSLFHRILAHDPLNLLASRYLARTLYHAGRLPDAEAAIRHVIDFNPAQPGAQYELGRILLAKGDRVAAFAAFEGETGAGWKTTDWRWAVTQRTTVRAPTPLWRTCCATRPARSFRSRRLILTAAMPAGRSNGSMPRSIRIRESCGCETTRCSKDCRATRAMQRFCAR